MKWIDKKEELNILINVENKSYEELGRIYNVSGEAVKRAASRLGINLPRRRKINPNEHFNKGTAKKLYVKIVTKNLLNINHIMAYIVHINAKKNSKIKN